MNDKTIDVFRRIHDSTNKGVKGKNLRELETGLNEAWALVLECCGIEVMCTAFPGYLASRSAEEGVSEAEFLETAKAHKETAIAAFVAAAEAAKAGGLDRAECTTGPIDALNHI